MAPLFIATETFGLADGAKWAKYIAWAGTPQIDEVITLDPGLCPTLLPVVKDRYWEHILNEDFHFGFFTDLDFLKDEIADAGEHRLLCVVQNPSERPAGGFERVRVRRF